MPGVVVVMDRDRGRGGLAQSVVAGRLHARGDLAVDHADPSVGLGRMPGDDRIDRGGVARIVDDHQLPVLSGLAEQVLDGAVKHHGPVAGAHDDGD